MYGIDLAYTEPLEQDFETILHSAILLRNPPSDSSFEDGVRYLHWSGVSRDTIERFIKLDLTNNAIFSRIAYVSVFTEADQVDKQEEIWHFYHADWYTMTGKRNH